MAYTTIDNPELYFQTKLYAGNGSSQSITFDGSEDMQPDWVWIKSRTDTRKHNLYDVVRGANKRLVSNLTSAEDQPDNNAGVNAFNSNGFTVGSETDVNGSSRNFVAWNWKAGTSFTNDASATGIGTIDSTGSVNTDAGFSIISYTGTGSAGTVAHGLGSAPAMIINKKYNTTENWFVYHKSLGNNKSIQLNSTAASYTSGNWGNTDPTSSVFSLSTTDSNTSGATYINYCFAEKKGYSKFGSYVGNGNANGTFVYTGFKPSWVMIKRTDSATGGYWVMFDNKRNTFNVMDKYLFAQSSDAEDTSNLIDFYSNGFRPIVSNLMHNGSGASYIYMAFAENPFVTSTGVPATAR